MFCRFLWAAMLMFSLALAQAAPPSGPYTADANTLLLLHFDGNLSDASAGAASASFSTLGGATNPSYVAGNTGFGQALEANGGTINGVIVNAPALSLTTAPLTVEGWMKFPAARQADDYTNSVLDLGAGRFLFTVRHEAGGNNAMPTLNMYDASGNPHYNYAVANASHGLSEGTWHHYAVVLDPSAATPATFYFDGIKLNTVGQANPPAVSGDFQKISYPASTAGRPDPAGAPTSNSHPLIGAIDEVRLSRGDRFGGANNSAVLLDLKFNGNLLDSSVYGRNGVLSTIAGYSDPTYTAGRDTTASQALTGSGGNLNGVVVNANELSQTTGPLTVEGWLSFPSADIAQDYVNTILDLGAGRFTFSVRHEAGGNYLYPSLVIYDNSTPSILPQENYASIPRSLGWDHDEWHKFALTYDPTRTPAVEFFFDGQKLALQTPGGRPTISAEFNKISEPARVAGRAIGTNNNAPLHGSIDDVRLVRGILYGNTASDSTIFHYEFENNLLDSGPNGYNGVLSAIAGFSDPSYAAGQAGQALSASGGTVNGVLIPNTLVSQSASPLTAEGWIYVPASEVGQEFPINIVDIAAGRFNFYVRHAGGSDPNIYLTLGIYTAADVSQQNYARVASTDGWSHDAWHHVAVTYDPARTVPVEFYFDGRRMGLATPDGGTPISEEFAKANEPGLIGGRVWPPASPSFNLMPLRGRVDDIKLSHAILYTQADTATTVYADIATSITVDGNAADWSALGSTELTLDTGGRGAMQALVRYAWDADYFYILIREAGAAGAQQEAANQAAYAAAPYSFDTVAFWIDLDQSNDGEQTAQDVNPWFGFSSSGRSDLYTGRLNNAAAYTQAPFIGATVRTSGTFAAHDRVIEARLKWSDLALVVDGPRQPNGDLVNSIGMGLKIGVEPLLIENDYNKQSFIGGGQYNVPSGIDANSRDVQLRGPNAAGAWELYR